MRTTTVGAFIRPDDLPRAELGEAERAGEAPIDRTGAWTRAIEGLDPGLLHRRFDAATAAAVAEQDRLGIDVPCESEVRREHPVYYHCRHLKGVDFERLEEVLDQEGRTVLLPRIVGPIVAGQPFLTENWRVAQRATARPVKLTLPGPMAIGAWLSDHYYDEDARARGAAIADAINSELRTLAAAGCRHIQLTEPTFVLAPEDTIAFGLEHVERCFHRLPREISRHLQLNIGETPEVDREDPPRVDTDGYAALADALEAARIDVVGLEGARTGLEPDFLERFAKRSVTLGVLDISVSEVEPVDTLLQRLRRALEHIDPQRLMVAPDGPLDGLPPDVARAKLRALVNAARALR